MKRDISLDLLRIICCFMVIAIHVTPDYAFTVTSNHPTLIQYQSLVIQSIVRIGLPVFFMLSGYYILNRKSEDLINFYKKRVASLLLPFLVYSLIHFYVINYISGDWKGVDIYLNMITSGTTVLSVHFWFVYAMLGLYIISPVVKYITDKIPQQDTVKSIAIMVVVFYYSLYSYSASQSFDNYHHLISVQGIDTWLLYFVVGGLLKRVNVSSKVLCAALPISLALHILVVYFSVNKFNYNLYPYDSGANMLFVCSVILLLFTKIKIQTNKITSTLIEKIAPLTYGIYLIHILVYRALEKYFDIPFIIDLLVIKTIVLSAAIFLISGLIVSVIDRLFIKKILMRV